jgi:prephenate dehydratase
MKIGYLGPEGTFSEEASLKYKNKIGKGTYRSYSTIHDILIAADKGEVDEAIVPIENSVEGSIGIVTDMLVNEVKLQIKQELVIPVKHYLLAKKNVPLKKITDVISIPIVLDQCSQASFCLQYSGSRKKSSIRNRHVRRGAPCGDRYKERGKTVWA